MDRLAITQVNASAGAGGAEGIARQLHRGYLARGHDATLLVGRGEAREPGVRPFPSDWRTRLRHDLAGVQRIADRRRGRETFAYPATRRVVQSLAGTDIVHLHNLHGGYFDLRVLPSLSARLPVFLTLHDAWLLSGHCAHSFDCERWRTGCGSCPDLTIYPAVTVDDTAGNWQRKRDIFQRSHLFLAAPSRWLARRVEASMLAPAIAELRVIPNGVDRTAFRPGDRAAARRELDLPADDPILLFVGSGAGTNPFKDLATLERAAALAGERLRRDLTLLVLGDTAPDRDAGHARIRFVPYLETTAAVARCYQAADLLVHAAHADTFPTTVLEAMACGTPVVATAVGGISEQVRSLGAGTGGDGWAAHPPAEATGVLVPRADAAAMAAAIAGLLADDQLRAQLGANAARVTERDYDAERQCDTYLEWYRRILVRRAAGAVPAAREHAVQPGE